MRPSFGCYCMLIDRHRQDGGSRHAPRRNETRAAQRAITSASAAPCASTTAPLTDRTSTLAADWPPIDAVSSQRRPSWPGSLSSPVSPSVHHLQTFVRYPRTRQPRGSRALRPGGDEAGVRVACSRTACLIQTANLARQSCLLQHAIMLHRVHLRPCPPRTSPSSSLAQDTGLSRRQHGFKSRRGHYIPQGFFGPKLQPPSEGCSFSMPNSNFSRHRWCRQ